MNDSQLTINLLETSTLLLTLLFLTQLYKWSAKSVKSAGH